MTITWRNISKQDTSDANSLLRTGLDTLNLGLDKLGSASKSVGNVIVQKETTDLNAAIDNELASLREHQLAARESFATEAERVASLPGIRELDLYGGINDRTIKSVEDVLKEDMGLTDPSKATPEQRMQAATIVNDATAAVEQLRADTVMDDEEFIRTAASIYQKKPGRRDKEARNLAKEFQTESFQPKPVNQRAIEINKKRIDAATSQQEAMFAKSNQNDEFMLQETYKDIFSSRDKYDKLTGPKELVDKALGVTYDENGSPDNFSATAWENINKSINTVRKGLEGATLSDFKGKIDIPIEIADADTKLNVSNAAIGTALERLGIDMEILQSLDSRDFASKREEVENELQQEIIHFLIREELYRKDKQGLNQKQQQQLQALEDLKGQSLDAEAKLYNVAQNAAGNIDYSKYR